MSDDWQPGDLALCVQGGAVSKTGTIYEVIDLVPGDGAACHRCGEKNWGLDTLLLVGITPAGTCKGGSASRFRKIRPLSDEERDSFEAELREPTRVPSHANTNRPRRTPMQATFGGERENRRG